MTYVLVIGGLVLWHTIFSAFDSDYDLLYAVILLLFVIFLELVKLNDRK